MTGTFEHQDLHGARFTAVNLQGARFAECDLSDAVLRAVDVSGAEIDAPWLLEGKAEATLLVNGVDVTGFVDAELNRRFPGREQRSAQTPGELREAFAALDVAWDQAVVRAEGMPQGTVDVQVAGEWSFAQTLRHLVLATDMWLGKPVLGLEQPFHRFGLDHDGDDEAAGSSVFSTEQPTWQQVLDARADRARMVRDYVASVTHEQLDEPRPNPHAPQHNETVRSCLHVILEEGWEHLRFATRDLDVIEASPASSA